MRPELNRGRMKNIMIEKLSSMNGKLILLRVVLFLFYGACAAVGPFVAVSLKRRGLTIAHLSLIYTIVPFFQFLGPVISGIVADKIGRPKPVLLANLLLLAVTLNCMQFIPYHSDTECSSSPIASCTYFSNSNSTDSLSLEEASTCDFHCLNSTSSDVCTLIESVFSNAARNETEDNSTFPFEKSYNCSFDIADMAAGCSKLLLQKCNLCNKKKYCKPKDQTTFLIACSVLLILYNVFKSICYRFMDVTSMAIVVAQKSHFGHERVFCSLGSIVFYVVSGCLFSFTQDKDKDMDYSTAFYLFDALIMLTILSLLNLDIQLQPKGKKMWKKGFMLLRDCDTLAFSLFLFMLGMCFAFSNTFPLLYLDNLGAPGLLLALNPAVQNIVALPFLIKSKILVEKIGSINMPLIAFIAYAVFFGTFSLLVDPWLSLATQVNAVLYYYLLWVAVVMHSHDIAPEDMTSTVIALIGSIHHAVGKGAGSALGGLTMAEYGGKAAFQLMAVFATAGAALYSIYLFVRKYLDVEKTKSIKKGDLHTVATGKSSICEKAIMNGK